MERLTPPSMMPIKTLRIVEPQHKPRYTLDDLRALATEYADTHEGAGRLSVQVMATKFIKWIEQREKEHDSPESNS